jgi:hypothetical protein
MLDSYFGKRERDFIRRYNAEPLNPESSPRDIDMEIIDRITRGGK